MLPELLATIPDLIRPVLDFARQLLEMARPQPIALEVAVAVVGLVLFIFESFWPEADKKSFCTGAISALGLVLLLSLIAKTGDAGASKGLALFYEADSLAMFFKRFALVTTIVILWMSYEYRQILSKYLPAGRPGAGLGEFYSLPVFTCAGLMWMASAVDFVMIFVSLELVTISFYILVAFMRRNAGSLEAGVKYLILGALSTGFLVYGIAWIYGMTGTTNLRVLADRLPDFQGNVTPLAFGVLLVLVGLGFKVAAVPFHLWVPDVYQGAPTPVTAFLSVGSKAAGFVVLIRVVQTFLNVPEFGSKLILIVSFLAGLTMLFGNLAALPQNNVKRLLAYSSIAHAGYLLVAVASVGGNSYAGEAIVFYLTAYLLMTLLSFMVLVLVSRHSGGDDLAHFEGLGKRSPYIAFAMLVAVMSLAGIPLTAGFVGKFFVFSAAVARGHWWLVGIGVLTVVCGFYYYLRIVRAMYWEKPRYEEAIQVESGTRFSISLMVILIFLLGIYPQPVLQWFRGNPGTASTQVAGVTSVRR